jgi:hypothetical protein
LEKEKNNYVSPVFQIWQFISMFKRVTGNSYDDLHWQSRLRSGKQSSAGVGWGDG